MEEARDFTTQESSGSPTLPRRSGRAEQRSSEHRHHASRSELRSRIDALRKQRRRLVLATAASVTACVLLAFMGRSLESKVDELEKTLAEERAQSQTRLEQVQADLTSARKGLKAAHASISTLVEQRIPGLQPLKLDEALPTASSVVRDVTFARATGSEQGYELKAVLENGSRVSVSPALRIVLFDQLGVQVGHARIGSDSESENLTLRPGEIRSHFAVIEVEPGSQASYFRLETIRD